jgi:DNA polymerase-3 subunit delta'
MQFKDIVGQKDTKHDLIQSFKSDKISHAQLFLGKPGYGTLALALAYSQYIFCENKSDDDSCGVCISCKQIS